MTFFFTFIFITTVGRVSIQSNSNSKPFVLNVCDTFIYLFIYFLIGTKEGKSNVSNFRFHCSNRDSFAKKKKKNSLPALICLLQLINVKIYICVFWEEYSVFTRLSSPSVWMLMKGADSSINSAVRGSKCEPFIKARARTRPKMKIPEQSTLVVTYS